MRRLTVMLLAACLALVTGPALAQSQSSSPTPVSDRQLSAGIEAVIIDGMGSVASGYWSAFR